MNACAETSSMLGGIKKINVQCKIKCHLYSSVQVSSETCVSSSNYPRSRTNIPDEFYLPLKRKVVFYVFSSFDKIHLIAECTKGKHMPWIDLSALGCWYTKATDLMINKPGNNNSLVCEFIILKQATQTHPFQSDIRMRNCRINWWINKKEYFLLDQKENDKMFLLICFISLHHRVLTCVIQ